MWPVRRVEPPPCFPQWEARMTRSEGEDAMSQGKTFEMVVQIVKPYAKNAEALEKVSLDTHILEDLEVNSARLVDVVLAFEDAFGIAIADEDVDLVNTIGDTVALIESKLAPTR
jgi:acyl carrier protein